MNLASMKVSQLKEEAAKVGAPINSTMKKADIIAAIEAVVREQSDDGAVVIEAEVIEDGTGDTALEITCNVGELSANFDALEAYVDGILSEYDGWEPSAESEEDVKQCADQKKYLNALAADLDSRRKAVKAQYLNPLNAFETRANAIRDKIKATSGRLNDVVAAAKKAEQDAKHEALKAHYEEYAEFLAPVVPYEKLHDPKWLNKEPKLPKAKEELEAKVNAIAADWENLKSLDLEFFDQAEACFFNTLSIGEAVAYNSNLVSSRKKIEEMKANVAAYGDATGTQGPEDAPATASEPAPIQVAAPAYQYNAPPAPEPAPSVPVPCAQEQPAPLAPQPNTAIDPSDPPRPCVMVIDAATTNQMTTIGRFCGSLSPRVTGVFKIGTLDEAYWNEIARREAANGRVG